MIDNQFILEAKYLDKINRVKRKSIIGVFGNLTKLEQAKEKAIAEEMKYKVVFSIKSNYNPFLVKSN
jgi:hypothetical protein